MKHISQFRIQNSELRKSANALSLLAVCLLLVAGCSVLFASEMGKITGRVVDQSTGQAVVGAAVQVEGTDLGVPTDENGRFEILDVQAGTWNVTVSAVGYGSETRSDVLVITDQAASVDFRLKSTVIEVPGITTTAQRPMVILSEVQTTRTMNAKDFARLPVSNLTAIVGLQAGVHYNPATGWTHIRGGRYNDVSYLIDGVSAKDMLVGTLWSSPRPTAENIEEVDVITGSFDAEYGEAMSGVIQTITKEGGEKTSGLLRYTTDEMFPGKDLNYGYNFVQATLGGPFFAEPLRYFVSGEYLRSADDAQSLWQINAPRKEYTLEGKVNYNLPKGIFAKNDNLKVIVDAHTSDYEWQAWSNAFQFEQQGEFANRVHSNKANLRLNYLPGASTLVELQAGIFDTRLIRSPQDYLAESQDTTGVSGFLRKNGLWDKYIFKSEQWVFDNREDSYPTTVHGKDTVIQGHMPPDVAVLRLYEAYREEANGTKVLDDWTQSQDLYNNPYGVADIFVTTGDDRIFHYRETYDNYAKGAVTFTPNKIHEFKTGFELTWYNMKEYTNSLPWDPNPFYENYDYQPFTASAYVQDKANFEDLVVRAGVRMDILNSNATYRVFPESIGGSPGVRDSEVEATTKIRFAPRIGISYPVTDRIKFRFSYGHFYRDPDFSDLYTSQLPAEELARRGNLIVGNPNLQPEKTIGYEMGFDDQLSNYFEFDVTGFYKDVYNLSGVRIVPALPQSYTLYYNVEYANIKGFELTATKALNHYWTAKLSYTFSIAKGTASTAEQQYLTTNPVQIDYYLDQDERHEVSADIGFSTDRTFSVGVLRQFDASLIARYGSGLPYTPTDIRGEQTGPENSARMPPTFEMDGRLNKAIPLGKTELNITCDIFNLLNNVQVASVYAATGKANFDGTIITLAQFSQTGYQIGDVAYQPARDHNHDGYISQQEKYQSYLAAYNTYINTPTNYGTSRKIQFGVSIGF